MKIRLLILVLAVLGLTSCQKEIITEEDCCQGTIQYEISYLNIDKDDLIYGILPKTMEISYEGNNICCKIEGAGGLFKMMQLYNKKEETFSTLLKIWNKKYIYEANASEIQNSFSNMNKVMIQKQTGEKEIAGYKCQKAYAYFTPGQPPVELFYTNDIPISNPNAHNPYNGIDGVLLDFQLTMNDLEMRLVAKNVLSDKSETALFSVPADYKEVQKTEMDKILASINLSKKS